MRNAEAEYWESLLNQANLPTEPRLIPRGGLDNLDQYKLDQGVLASHYQSGLDWGCLICGHDMDQPDGPGRPRQTCSDTCRQRLHRLRQRMLLQKVG